MAKVGGRIEERAEGQSPRGNGNDEVEVDGKAVRRWSGRGKEKGDGAVKRIGTCIWGYNRGNAEKETEAKESARRKGR